MPPRKPVPRPDPIHLADLSLSVVRGPRPDARWYWRARSTADRSTLWTGWATRDEAARQGAHLLVKPSAAPASTQLRTVGEVIQRWLDAQLQNTDLRPATRRVYAQFCRPLLHHLGRMPVEALRRADLESYRGARLAAGTAPRSIQKELGALAQAWKRALAQRLIPNRGLPAVKVKVQGYVLNHRTPTEAEVAALLPHLAAEDALALQLLAATGARVSEITSLTRDAIDTRARRVHLHGKTGHREFPLTEDLEALLADRLDGTRRPVLDLPLRHPRQRVYDALKRACKRAGIPPFTPHGLRRLAVDRMARAGVEVSTAASLTGHNPVVMLNDYRQVRPDELLAAVLRADVDAVLRGAP